MTGKEAVDYRDSWLRPPDRCWRLTERVDSRLASALEQRGSGRKWVLAHRRTTGPMAVRLYASDLHFLRLPAI